MGKDLNSVSLIKDKCKGCTHCLQKCPTEAIRVRDGKAVINDKFCIDCGECIRTCPNRAKTVKKDSSFDLSSFKYKIAIPAPALYGQFPKHVSPDQVLTGLKKLGFDDVMEAAFGADILTQVTKEYLKQGVLERPVISSACPAVVRLIQVRFPELVYHLLPFDAPVEIAARVIREETRRRTGLNDKEIGIFFISPCPAKISAIKNPLGKEYSELNGAIPINEIYGDLVKQIEHLKDYSPLRRASGLGIGWARSGGENVALGIENYITVDGTQNVIRALEDMDMGKVTYKNIDYLECLACPGGCVGGALAVENQFVARVNIRHLAEKLPPVEKGEQKFDYRVYVEQDALGIDYETSTPSVYKLDQDMHTAIHKIEMIEKTYEELPGLDCGACGAPTCQALAEDIVQGTAMEFDCIFKLRDKVKNLALEMAELAGKLPPAMGKREEKEGR